MQILLALYTIKPELITNIFEAVDLDFKKGSVMQEEEWLDLIKHNAPPPPATPTTNRSSAKNDVKAKDDGEIHVLANIDYPHNVVLETCPVPPLSLMFFLCSFSLSLLHYHSNKSFTYTSFVVFRIWI